MTVICETANRAEAANRPVRMEHALCRGEWRNLRQIGACSCRCHL